MARRDLTNKEIEEWALREPGAPAQYLKERQEEIEAEKQAERDKAQQERFVQAFVNGGGTATAAKEAWKVKQNQHALEVAEAADQAALVASRSRIGSVL
jgi:hypothetical protein